MSEIEVARRDTLVPEGMPHLAWVATLPAVADLAGKIAGTDFVPQSLRGKPAQVAAAILAGQELGLGPMASLAGIAVINGRPTLSAATMRALILSHGHEVWAEEMSNAKVTMCGRRRGSDHVTTVTWTITDARAAGLTSANYSKYPRQMLAARATAELARLVFADVLGGVAYAPEEAEEHPPQAEKPKTPIRRAVEAPRSPEPPRVATDAPPLPGDEPEAVPEPRETPAVEAEEPPPGTPETPPEAPETAPEGVTTAQMRHIQALFRDLAVTDREQRLEWARDIVGRDISTSKELTKDEASTLIERLKYIREVTASEESTAVDEPTPVPVEQPELDLPPIPEER